MLSLNLGVLELDMREENGKKLVKEINNTFDLLPNLRLLSIRYIDENNEDIKQMMLNSVGSIQSLFFNNHVRADFRTSKVNIGTYMEVGILV